MRHAILFLLPAVLVSCLEVDKSDDDDDDDDDGWSDSGVATGGDAGDGTGDDGGTGGSGDGGSGDGGSGDGGSGDEGSGDGGSGDGGSGAGGGDEGGDEGPPPLLPSEGRWTPANFTVTSDPCNLTNFEDPSSFIPDAFEIADVTTTGFLIGEPGSASTACAYAEPDFTCDGARTEQDVGFGLDAVLLLDNVFGGTVNSETDIDGRIDLEVTCDGSACGILSAAGLSFPCLLEGQFDLTY